jgi:Fe-S-cluster-containing hydrogenase component 2
VNQRVPPCNLSLSLRIALARLWRVKWENMNKEVFWRMTVDGVPIVGNSHMRGQATPCLCGVPMGASVRRHHFWECAAAQEVVGCVAAVVACPVGITSVWLAQPPAGIMQQCVWDVVCLAMLSSMEEARIVLKVGARDASGSGDVVAHAKARAVSGFWRRLSDFVAIGPAPRDWVNVPVDHPFVGVENGFLRLRRPVA